MSNTGDGSGTPHVDVTDEDPYSDIILSELPDWWQKAIEEFREYNLDPYQPPVFKDGIYKYEIVNELEEELEADIDFIGREVPESDNWIVRIDNHPIGTIGHHRNSGGYSVYEMASQKFRKWVLNQIDEAPANVE